MENIDLRSRILTLVSEYSNEIHATNTFIPGESPIPVSGKVFGSEEVCTLVDSALDFWLTTGRFNEAFEKRLATYLNIRHLLTCNSGSSANLLATAALTSSKLGDRALKPGDEVISVAAAFPSTVNPLLQYGLVPVFVDVELGTYNIDSSKVEDAITDKTRAIMIAHTLGNPFDLDTLTTLAKNHDLWLIEDSCDALGSTYNDQLVGTFGDIGTLSFYPAHHITMGEGGAVFTKSPILKRLIESFRDWGRDCFCDPGKDNTCGKRFDWQLGSLPYGYDHKYTYSHVGYNLKITDMQAAVGLAQLNRLDEFISARKSNFAWLNQNLSSLEEFFILPKATQNSDPAWFGFPLTIRDGCDINREHLLKFLTEKKIGTRLLFGGNLTRQPYFQNQHYRIAQDLAVTDKIMRDTFWLGVFPGLSHEMLQYVVTQLKEYIHSHRRT